MRIFGPCRSPMIATCLPTASEISRTARICRPRSSQLPCEQLMRTTSVPASISSARTPGSSVAGPRVAMILVLRMPGLRAADAVGGRHSHMARDLGHATRVSAIKSGEENPRCRGQPVAGWREEYRDQVLCDPAQPPARTADHAASRCDCQSGVYARRARPLERVDALTPGKPGEPRHTAMIVVSRVS